MDFNFLSYRNNFFSYIFIVLILCTTLLGYYGSVDKVSAQWLYLSAALVLSFIYFAFKSISALKPFLKLPTSKLILSVLLLSIISFFSANNATEVVIGISKWIIYFFLFYSFYLFFIKHPISFLDVSIIVSFILLLEISYSLSTLLDILSITNFDNQYSNLLKGVTGNKNITAVVFAIKLPFVFYTLIYSSKLYF